MYSYVSLHTKYIKYMCRFLVLTVFIIIMPAVLSSKSYRIDIYISPSIYLLLVQGRVTLDRTLLRTRSNLELREETHSVLLCSFLKLHLHLPFSLSLIGPLSSHTRQNSTSNQVQCRAQRDTWYPFTALFNNIPNGLPGIKHGLSSYSNLNLVLLNQEAIVGT